MTEPFDPELERELLAESSARSQAIQRAQQDFANPVIRGELERMAERYPWLDASAIDGLASSGLSADDEAVRLAAGAAVAEQQELGTANGRALTPSEMKAVALATEAVRNVSAPRRLFGVDVGSVVDIASPFLPGLQAANVTRDESQESLGRAVSAVDTAAQPVLGAVGLGEGSLVREALKPVTQYGFAAMDVPQQTLQGAASMVNDAVVRDGWVSGLMDLANRPTLSLQMEAFQQTELGAITSEVSESIAERRSPDLDMGNGFFINPESPIGRRRQDRRMRYESVDGQPFSIGRWAAGSLTDAGTKEHAIMSGLLDLSLEITGPGAVADHVILGTRSARKSINAGNASTFLQSRTGQDVIQKLVESDSFRYVDQALGRQADPSVVEAIRLSDDPEMVERMIRGQIGIEITEKPRINRFGHLADFSQSNIPSVNRWFEKVPEGYMSITDARQRVTNAERYLKTANATPKEIDYFASRMASAVETNDILDATREMVELTALRALNDELPDASKIVIGGSPEVIARDFGDTRGKGVYYHGAGGPIESLTEGYYSSQNFYGNGFYVSDSAEVGLGYGKGAARNAEWRLINDHRQYLQQEGMFRDGYSSAIPNDRDFINDVRALAGEPPLPEGGQRLYRVEETDDVRLFDLEQTYNADTMPSPSGDAINLSDDAIDAAIVGGFDFDNPGSVRELFDSIRRGSKSEGLTPDVVQEIYDGFSNALSREGFGGYSHRATHKSLDGEYDVKIYWNAQDQVRISEEALETIVEGDDVGQILRNADSKDARKIARMWADEYDQTRAYHVRQILEADGTFSTQHLDSWQEGHPTPQAYAELLSTNIPIPDYREVRSVFASPGYKTFQALPAGERTAELFEMLVSPAMAVWKTGRLARIAWPVKVLTEGQLRLAMFGFSSIINRPDDYLAYAFLGRGAKDSVGDFMDASEAAKRAKFITSDVTRIGDAQQRSFMKEYREYYRRGNPNPGASVVEDEEFVKHWAEKANQLYTSPEFRIYFRAETFDEAVSEFFSESNRIIRRAIQNSRPTDTLDIVNNIDDARIYMKKNVVDRIDEMTNGNPDLLEVLRDGSFRGERLIPKGKTSLGGKAVKAIREEAFDSLPMVVTGRKALPKELQSEMAGFVNKMFSFLMSTPSNKLDRSPLFNQQYWKTTERLARYLDPKDAKLLIGNMRGRINKRSWELLRNSKLDGKELGAIASRLQSGKGLTKEHIALIKKSGLTEAAVTEILNTAQGAKLSRKQRDAISAAARMTPPSGTGRAIRLAELDQVAKAESLNAVKKVLYDASERNQFFDIWRHVFPFGDAFVEVMSRWMQIFATNPNRINKAEAIGQEVQGAFSEGQFGEEMFSIPGSGQILSLVAPMIDMELQGMRSGLSIATEMWPGYGPVIQIPASLVLPKEPEYQWWRDHLSSGFGLPPNILDQPGDVLADFLIPAWMEKMFTWAQAEFGDGKPGLTQNDKRLFANHQSEVMMHLIANDPNWALQTINSPEREQALHDESRRIAGRTVAIRAAAQFAVPGAPSFEFYTDVTDERMAAWRLDEAYRAMQEQMGPGAAAVEFLNRYGEDAYGLVRPKSRDLTSGGGMPVHQGGIDWVQENDFAQVRYPETYGFFAPMPGEDDDLVYDVYVATFSNDERQALSPEMSFGLLQDDVARIEYGIQRDLVLERFDGKATREVQEYLRGVRDVLETQYPGYAGVPGVAEKVSVPVQIGQLEKAVSDPDLSDNPLVPFLEEYLTQREYINSISSGASFDTGTKADAGLRAYMYRVGTVLAGDSPQFAEVWERVLYREFRSSHEQDSKDS